MDLLVDVSPLASASPLAAEEATKSTHQHLVLHWFHLQVERVSEVAKQLVHEVEVLEHMKR